jgi:hypothetical protein
VLQTPNLVLDGFITNGFAAPLSTKSLLQLITAVFIREPATREGIFSHRANWTFHGWISRHKAIYIFVMEAGHLPTRDEIQEELYADLCGLCTEFLVDVILLRVVIEVRLEGKSLSALFEQELCSRQWKLSSFYEKCHSPESSWSAWTLNYEGQSPPSDQYLVDQADEEGVIARFTHYTLAALQDSAITGCKLCRLLEDIIVVSPPSKAGCHIVMEISDRAVEVLGELHPIASRLKTKSKEEHLPQILIAYKTLQDVQYAGCVQVMSLQKNQSFPSRRFIGEPWRIPSLSKASLQSISHSMSDCKLNHKLCRRDHGLPGRLLDLWSDPDRRDIVSLVEPVGNEEFIALSYCWGGEVPMKTTRALLWDYMRRIPLKELPATFRDAVTMCRNLQVRYLWIDALCIIQDDEEDWEREAGLMAQVYSNAALVIAASASPSSRGGLQLQRVVRMSEESEGARRAGISALRLTISEHMDVPAYLNARGWCFQEKALATAYLAVQHDRSEWECKTTRYTLKSDVPALKYPELSTASVTNHQSPMSRWYQGVADYSGRVLTKRSDRLIALAGFAERIEHESRAAHQPLERYLAGIWEGDLMRGLTWAIVEPEDEPKSQPTQSFPSWTWASVLRKVQYENHPFEKEDRYFATIDHRHIKINNPSYSAKEVQGHIPIRGPIRAGYSPSFLQYSVDSFAQYQQLGTSTFHVGFKENLDYSSNRNLGDLFLLGLYCILYGMGPGASPRSKIKAFFLLIQPVNYPAGHTEQYFRRVGLVMFEFGSHVDIGDDVIEDYFLKDAKIASIRLV